MKKKHIAINAKAIVKTELTGKMTAEYSSINLLRLWWLFMPIGLIIIFGSIALFIFEGDVAGGCFVGFFGLFFSIGIFFFPKMFSKLDDRFIPPNLIKISFYSDIINIKVTTGNKIKETLNK